AGESDVPGVRERPAQRQRFRAVVVAVDADTDGVRGGIDGPHRDAAGGGYLQVRTHHDAAVEVDVPARGDVPVEGEAAGRRVGLVAARRHRGDAGGGGGDQVQRGEVRDRARDRDRIAGEVEVLVAVDTCHR